MQIDRHGRSAIISGSTAGIGLAIATGLVRAGASVTLTGRTQDVSMTPSPKLKRDVPDSRVQGVAADLGTRKAATR